MGKIKNFIDLEVWQIAHALVLDVYKFTSLLPSEERYGLVAQMRRSAVSVPANIAEGFKRKGQQEKAHFYNIAQGSLEELRYYFILVNDLGYLVDGRWNVVDRKEEKEETKTPSTTYNIPPTSNIEEMNERIDQIGRMLSGLIKSIRS